MGSAAWSSGSRPTPDGRVVHPALSRGAADAFEMRGVREKHVCAVRRRPSAPTSAFIRRRRRPPAGSGRSCCSSIPGTPSRLGRACAMPWPSGGQGPMPRRPLRVVARFKPRCGHGRRRARAAPAIGAVVCEHVREVALRARAGGVEPGCIDGGQRRRRSLAPWWSVPRRSNLGGRRVCEDLCAEEEEERSLHAGAEVDVSGE